MLASEDSFFFDQLPFRQPQKRYKKNAEELPQSLRYAHLNPKLASFYKDSKSGDEEENQGSEACVFTCYLYLLSNTMCLISLYINLLICLN